MDLRKVRVWIILSFLCTTICVCGSFTQQGWLHTVSIVGLCVSFVSLIVSLLCFRCPHCCRGLSRNMFFINYCPYCGNDLYE